MKSRNRWSLRRAQARLSILIQQARTDGAQYVTYRHGAVVVLSIEEYERLSRRALQPQTLVEFFAQSPLRGLALDLDRPRKPDPKRR